VENPESKVLFPICIIRRNPLLKMLNGRKW